MYILASDAFVKKRKRIYINCVKKRARIALQKIASLEKKSVLNARLGKREELKGWNETKSAFRK